MPPATNSPPFVKGDQGGFKMDQTINKTTLSVISGDITTQETDAIVNAANSGLVGGGGVDGAIHRAGGPTIMEECRKIVAERGRLPAGQAVITTAGNLKSKYVIHTVGPFWHGGKDNEPETLTSAYQESLKLAVDNNLKSVSFPSISTGAYGYPLYLAPEIALNAVIDFLNKDTNLEQVAFVLFDMYTYDAFWKTLIKILGIEDQYGH